MKKVLIFSMGYNPFIGGAEIAVKEITDRITDIEWHMVTCSLGRDLPKEEIIGKIKVHRVSSPKILFPFFAFWKASRLHKINKYDIAWSIMTYAGFAGLFFKIFYKKTKFLLTLQEGTPISNIKMKSFFVYPLFILMFRKADKIQAISNFLATFGRDMGHKKEIEIIPNGVDIKNFSKPISEEEKNKIKNVLGKKTEDVFLVTTSRLVKKNAVDDIISALKYLPPNVHLLVIGKGPEGFCLQKQTEVLGLEDRVKFLGFVEQKDIPECFSVCDIFVRPSRSEGFGNSFIEAMASKIPVVATPVGGIVDFIDDKETGVFCSPDNPKSLADAIGILLNDKNLVEHIVSTAYNRVKERYSWDFIGEQMKDRVFNNL